LRGVNELTPFPVLGVVSAAFPTQEGVEHRAEVWRFSAATAVFIAAFVVVLALNLMEAPRTEQGVQAVAKS
jgi:anti-sigma-K factor RskA